MISVVKIPEVEIKYFLPQTYIKYKLRVQARRSREAGKGALAPPFLQDRGIPSK